MSLSTRDDELLLSGILLLGLDPASGPYIFHQYPADIVADRQERSVFSTIKNFTEVFLPRTELTDRVCWHYEADTTHLVMYIALEFAGVNYTRNLMRVTVCFVFDCPAMMTTSAAPLEDILRSYAVALLNIAELLKDLEKRFNYLFHFFDPAGDFYDANRCSQSKLKDEVPLNPTVSTISAHQNNVQSTAVTSSFFVTDSSASGEGSSPPAVATTPAQRRGLPEAATTSVVVGRASDGMPSVEIVGSSAPRETSPAGSYTMSSLDGSYSLPAALMMRSSSEERPLRDGQILLGLTPEAVAAGSVERESHPLHLDPGDILIESYEFGSGGTVSDRNTAVPLAVTSKSGGEAAATSTNGTPAPRLRRVYYGASRRHGSSVAAPDQLPTSAATGGGTTSNNTSTLLIPKFLEQHQSSATPQANASGRLTVTLPLSRASASDLHDVAQSAGMSRVASAQDGAGGTFVDLYDLCFVVERALDCVLEIGDCIPISERSSVTVRCGKRNGSGGPVRPLYPDQRVVPIVSPTDVMAWGATSAGEFSPSPAGDKHRTVEPSSFGIGGGAMGGGDIAASPQRVWTGWSDLTITEVYQAIDGMRTVEEVIQQYCSSGGATAPVEPWVWDFLYEFHAPADEVPTAGCKRGGGGGGGSGGSSTPTTSSTEPNFGRPTVVGRQAALHQRKNKIRAAKRLASMADMPRDAASLPRSTLPSSASAAQSSGVPSISNIPRRVLYALEALQHLQQCNWVMVLDPITSSSVYVGTPQLYAALSSSDDSVRDALGRRLLAVNAAVHHVAMMQLQRKQQQQQQHNNASGAQRGQLSSPAPTAVAQRQEATPHRGHQSDVTAALGHNASLSRRVDSVDAIPPEDFEVLTPMCEPATANIASFGVSGRSLAGPTPPPPLTCFGAAVHGGAVDEIVDSVSERRRIGEILNLAAQQGYPSLTQFVMRRRESTPPMNHANDNDRDECSDSGQRTPPGATGGGVVASTQYTPARKEQSTRYGVTDLELVAAAAAIDLAAVDEEIELAASAAFRALVRFQFCSVAAVTQEMRRCPFWAEWFSSWSPEVMVALVEFGLMNGWLLESDGS